MIKVENAYIFNCGINANNFKILNDIEFIKKQLINIPIIKKNKPIGLVHEITNVIDDKIYGTIFYFKDKYKEYKYLKNYEIVIEDIRQDYHRNVQGVYIKSISSIELSKKKEEN